MQKNDLILPIFMDFETDGFVAFTSLSYYCNNFIWLFHFTILNIFYQILYSPVVKVLDS